MPRNCDGNYGTLILERGRMAFMEGNIWKWPYMAIWVDGQPKVLGLFCVGKYNPRKISE